MKATAWAVLDANGFVLSVQFSRVIAACMVRDGGRVAPLVLAEMSDVEDED